MGGAVLSYQQSDEISVLLADFGSVHAQPWFGGVAQKMTSIAASVATREFNYRAASRAEFAVPHCRAVFDARVFTIPDPVEVANYLVWRQRDAVRNSVSMAAQAHFPHKRLHGLNGGQMQELLWQEKGVNWNDYPGGAKRGRVCRRVTAEADVTYTDKRTLTEVSTTAMRSNWITGAAPTFTAQPGSFLAEAIPALPSLRGEESLTATV
jgi:tRNA(His) guanylyltransferase